MPDDRQKSSSIHAKKLDRLKPDTTRRRVLQVAGAAGLTGFGVPVSAAAEENDAKASDVTFAELGVSFDHSADVEQDDHYDPLDFYKITDGELVFSAIKQSNLEIFQESDAVVRFDDFHGLPTQLTRRQYGSIWGDLNTRLRPTGGTLLSEPVSTPAIRAENEGSDIIVAASGNEARVTPGASKTINLGSVSSTTRDGQSIEATAKATVKNYGTLDVLVNHVQEGE